MLDWFSRLMRRPDAAPVPPAGAAATATAVAPMQAPAFGQRKPLVGRSGRVEAFELRLPGAIEQRLGDQAAGAAAAAHYAALLAAAAGVQTARQALAQVPAPLLDRPGVIAQVAKGVLLLPVGGMPTAASLQALRARGARLGVPDGPPDRAPGAEFVLLRAAAGGVDTLLLSAQRWAEARPGLPLVALGLENIDDVERALASGIAYAGGRFNAADIAAPTRPLQAGAVRICGLLNDLALDRDTTVVAEAVRGDVALSYRLLRYANSPAIGLSRGVETVENAVTVLGRAELGRWLSVMLLSAASGRQASAALQEEALARGRLLELLARARGVEQADRLFTVGLLSRLHLLLRIPLRSALEPLRLSDEARRALLDRAGPWADYLALADELEGDDEDRFGALCLPFGGIDTVLALAEQAWGWAAGVTQQAASPSI
ncbi:MAG: HDOD domain-containing protein [Burkholderiales bacterium]|nr:HDOD domain-containing protein [Burkholderiales bacterium]